MRKNILDIRFYLILLFLSASAGIAVWLITNIRFGDWIESPIQVQVTMAVNTEYLQPVAQLFFDTGNGFNEIESNIQPVGHGNTLRVLRFNLPNQPVVGLRFDPLNAGGNIHIHQISIVNRESKTGGRQNMFAFYSERALDGKKFNRLSRPDQQQG